MAELTHLREYYAARSDGQVGLSNLLTYIQELLQQSQLEASVFKACFDIMRELLNKSENGIKCGCPFVEICSSWSTFVAGLPDCRVTTVLTFLVNVGQVYPVSLLKRTEEIQDVVVQREIFQNSEWCHLSMELLTDMLCAIFGLEISNGFQIFNRPPVECWHVRHDYCLEMRREIAEKGIIVKLIPSLCKR